MPGEPPLGGVRRPGGGLQETASHGHIGRRRRGVAVCVDPHRSRHRMVELAVYAELADAVARVELAELFPWA